MTHYDSLKKHLAEIETSLEEDMAPFALQVEQLNSIYGISTTASCAIIAEIGIDMKPFKTAEHICSWAGLCPGNNESAGKRKSTSVTKGNPYIKSAENKSQQSDHYISQCGAAAQNCCRSFKA